MTYIISNHKTTISLVYTIWWRLDRIQRCRKLKQNEKKHNNNTIYLNTFENVIPGVGKWVFRPQTKCVIMIHPEIAVHCK